jgi:hypothetical protein
MYSVYYQPTVEIHSNEQLAITETEGYFAGKFSGIQEWSKRRKYMYRFNLKDVL